MKKLVLILFVLLAAETYGVYGAAVTKKVTKRCTLEAGPLCYAWEDNALGKLLGDKNVDEPEKQLEKAKKAWNEDFIEKTVKQKTATGLDKTIDESLDAAKKAVEKAVEDLKK